VLIIIEFLLCIITVTSDFERHSQNTENIKFACIKRTQVNANSYERKSLNNLEK